MRSLLRIYLVALAPTLALAGCQVRDVSREARAADSSRTASAGGEVAPADSLANSVVSETPALGPGIQVTPTDQHNVTRALELELTQQNWTTFLRAADSVGFLRLRDAEVRQYLDQRIVGAREDDAGEKWLESNPKVSSAIENAGMTVKDYFRMGIAVSAASRFIDDPSAAPPTPALKKNAEFLRDHRRDLVRLKDVSNGRPTKIREP
jgi:hypothetical protein